MNSIPEEIVKQAEELIKEHTILMRGTNNRPLGILAAIVSCEFALPYAYTAKAQEDVLQTKEYLEGLL